MSHQLPVFCTLFQDQNLLCPFALDRNASLHDMMTRIRRSVVLPNKGILLRTDQGEEITSDEHLAFLLRHPTGAVQFFMSRSRFSPEHSILISSRLARDSHPIPSPRHRSKTCGNCHEEIEGTRFQCLHCPVQFNLCSGCEAFQCRVHFHPKKHVFAKFCNSSQTLPVRFMLSTESSRPSHGALRAGRLEAFEQTRQERDSLRQLRRVPRESEPFDPIFAQSSRDRHLNSYGAPCRVHLSHKSQEHRPRNPGEAPPLRSGRDFSRYESPFDSDVEPHRDSLFVSSVSCCVPFARPRNPGEAPPLRSGRGFPRHESPFDSDMEPLFDGPSGPSVSCRVPFARNQRDSPSY